MSLADTDWCRLDRECCCCGADSGLSQVEIERTDHRLSIIWPSAVEVTRLSITADPRLTLSYAGRSRNKREFSPFWRPSDQLVCLSSDSWQTSAAAATETATALEVKGGISHNRLTIAVIDALATIWAKQTERLRARQVMNSACAKAP